MESIRPLFFSCLKCIPGGGNSNIFYVHPYLGKISNLTGAYFSDGWFNQKHRPVFFRFPKFRFPPARVFVDSSGTRGLGELSPVDCGQLMQPTKKMSCVKRGRSTMLTMGRYERYAIYRHEKPSIFSAKCR